MKRYSLTALILSLFAVLMFTACDTEGDDLMIPTRDCTIKNIVLGTMQKRVTVKDSKGQDSLTIHEVPGTQYPLSIDQINGKIFNCDSLPKGTDLTKIKLATLNSTGYVSVKSLTTGKDTILTINDTLDYSKPRVITVHANDLRYSRDYTIELRVHTEEPDSIYWQNQTPAASSVLTGFKDCRVVAAGQSLYVFGQLDNGASQVIATQTTAPDFNTASALTTADGKALDVRSIQYLGDTFYGLSEGKIYQTREVSEPWTAAESSMSHLDALVACSTDSLYALENGQMYVSADGCQWIASAADTENKWPTDNMASTLFQPVDKPGESILLLAGNLNAEPVVWQHFFKENAYFSYPWMFMPQTEELKEFAYPDLEQATLLTYDDEPLLFGIAPDSQKPSFYHSEDGGRTWKAIDMKIPAPAQAGRIGLTVDNDHYVWSVFCATGQVFKGRHNRLGWLMR